jgi:hypothetical protein
MKYIIKGTFETNRPMTEKEREDILNTLQLQLDEPWVEQEDGQWDDSEFTITESKLEMEEVW